MNGLTRAVASARREYTEWPTVSLTLHQACRLWSAEEGVCAAALGALVREGFLLRRLDGRFVRAPLPKPLHAPLRVTLRDRPAAV